MDKIKNFYEKYKHGVQLLIYFPIYLTWFAWLEKNVTKHYNVIHVDWDDYIPFCEIFIVPYVLWFLYVAVVIIYLFLTNRQDFIKSCIFLFTGMTVFLFVSTFLPNGHMLRPRIMPRDNIFTQMIQILYSTDTSTNIWPSIHVFNSIGTHLAVVNCRKLRTHKFITYSSLILCVSIVLSTVLNKQHSVFDVFTAFILAACMYVVVYHRQYSFVAHYFDTRKKHSQPRIS